MKTLRQRLWWALFEASETITDREVREQRRITAVVTLATTLASLSGAIATFKNRPDATPFLVLATLCLFVSYLLSRTKLSRIAGILAIVYVIIPSVNSVVRAQQTDQLGVMLALVWFALPMVMSSLVLSRWSNIVANVAILSWALLLAKISAVPTCSYTIATLSFLGIIGFFNIAVGQVTHANRDALRKMLAERDRAEAALREAKEKLEQRVIERTSELTLSNETLGAVITSSPAAVIIVDQEGAVDTWNPAAERILGWIESEVKGAPLPFEVAELQAHPPDEQGLKHGLPDRILDREVSVTCKKGDTIDASLSTAPLLDPGGQRVGLLALIVDISERKQLEEQLFQSQKMEAVGRLAGGVAHDFNNMLTIINGSADLVLTDNRLGVETRDDVIEIRKAGHRAAELTQRLLAYSRRQVLLPKTLDLNQVIDSMGGLLRRVLSEDIDLKLDLEQNLGTVLADRGQVEQVILNLAVNARDAMPEGGELTLRTHNSSSEDRVRLIVEDSGQGIPPEIIDQIFEPFFTTKEVGKGTGLGLSMIYGVVMQSNGTIDVESTPGMGTRFEISLPLVQAESDKSRDSTPPRVVGGSETILVIEDEASVRALVSRVLENLGYEIIEAVTAAQAIELYADAEDRIDLVLTDVVMPEMGGIECVRRLKKIREDVPVLFVSGHADDEIRRHGALEGALLYKPFTAPELAKAIRKTLRRSHESS